MTEECPFVATPESVVFDKVLPGVTYTKKITLRNRDSVGRRLRLEVDPRSPFRVSLPIYPGDVASSADCGSSRRLCHSATPVSGTVATGMCVQFSVSFSPSASTTEAFGNLEIHTENGAFAIPVVARRELPSLHPLPQKLDFGAVRLGKSTSLKLPLSYKGGGGAIKALVLSKEEIQVLRARTSSCASDCADQGNVLAMQLHGQAHRRQHTDAFGVSTEQVVLRKELDMPSLTVTFAPKAAGTFAAWLVLIPAEPVNLRTTYEMAVRPADAGATQPLGMLELHGIGDLAMLTLSEFCGTKWPVDLLATMVPICLADKLQNTRKNEPDDAKPQAARSKTRTSVCQKPIVREGRLDGKSLNSLAKTIFPREIDFGGVLPQANPVVRSLTLCNEGLLPVCVVWQPAEANPKASSSPVVEKTMDASFFAPGGDPNPQKAFSVSPLEAVIQPQGSCQFSFSVNPGLLPSNAQLSDASVSSSRESSFYSVFYLYMLDIPRLALLSPKDFFDKKTFNFFKVARGERQQQQDAMSLTRWLPLFVESEDSQTLAAHDSEGKPREGADWKMLRLQLRVKQEPAKVVVLGASPNGNPFPITTLSPGLVQELPLWIKNQGLVDVRVSLPSSLLALKACWRRPEPSGTRRSDGNRNELTFEDGLSTAWLLRVEEQELKELLQESDPVFGYGPLPFGYFCISPQAGLPLASGTCGAVTLRILPLCCGFFSTQVPVTVFPRDPRVLLGVDESAETPSLVSLPFQVSPPRVAACWPPQIDFGIVRAHSRTTRALLLYNNANVPTVARVRVLAPDLSSTKATEALPSDGANAIDTGGDYSGDFPCYFFSSLLRAPLSTTAQPSTEASLATGETTCSGDAREHSELDSRVTTTAFPYPVSRRCCTSCLCVDNSMRFAEPFVQDPQRAATVAAKAATSEIMHVGTKHRFCTGKHDLMHQQRECLVQHLAQWDHHYQGQQLQEQKQASAVIALSGLLLVFPSYVVLPPGGRGVILFTLRASHPQDISITTLVETLEGSMPTVVPLKGRVTVPRLRLSTQHVQLPPLHVLHTYSVQQQLTVHNDSDLPVRIKWSTATKELVGSQHSQLSSEQQEELGGAAGIVQAPCLDENAALLVSLSPSECILEKRSSVSLQISCLGLRAALRVQARALCQAEGSVIPLLVSFAARCNGVSVTYCLLSQQQLLAAAALLKGRREDRQQRTLLTRKNALRWSERSNVQGHQHKKCVADAVCWSDTISCDSRPQNNKRHPARSTERRDGSNSRSNGDSSSHHEEHNCDNPADICSALQEAGIGLWGSLQEQPPESLKQGHQVDLKPCDVDAGGEASFLYLFVCNCCPIPAKVTLQAFTHNTGQQQQQQNELSERHPVLSEEGRPAEAFTCADCNKNQNQSIPDAGEKSHTPSWLVGRNIASCSSGRGSCPTRLTAEALLVKAASAKAPLELQQLQQSAFGGTRPSFKTPTGVQTLQVLAGQRRRQHLISGVKEGLVLIPHPESTCRLGQNQSALLAVEIIAGHPGDFHAALRLSLEPSSATHRQASLPQQRQEVLFPMLLHVRGKALVLPPLQPRIRLGWTRPPVLAAHMTLQAPSSAVEQRRQLQQQQQACLLPTCYRSNKRLFPLKKIAESAEALTAATETGTSLRPEESVPQQPQYLEQRATFRVQNQSCRWMRVKWLLFDLGLWEMQQQLQEQLERANTLKVAAIEALHERAVLTARKAAAAAEAAVSAAATAATLPTLPLTARRPVRAMPAGVPDPAIVAAEAAAAAAVVAEEAAFYATEAASAAAATGMESASDGWEAIAAITAAAADLAAGCVKRGGEQEQQEQLGADDVSSLLHEDSETLMLGMTESAITISNHPTSPAAKSKQLAGGFTRAVPAWSAEKTNRLVFSPAGWRDEVAKLIPPSNCLISFGSTVSVAARGIAAAAEVLRSLTASNSTVPTTAKAKPPSDGTIYAKECLVSGGDCEATEELNVLTGSLEAASAEAQTGTRSSAQRSATDACYGAVGTCGVGGHAAERSSVEYQLQEEMGGTPENSKSARSTGTEREVLVVPPPRIEPEEAIIAPYESFEVSLRFGNLQTAEGVHRLRAIALPESICPEAPQGIEVTAAHAAVAGECDVACGWDQHLTAGRRAKPQSQQGQQDFVVAEGLIKTKPCTDPLQQEHATKYPLLTHELVDSKSRDRMSQEEHTAALHQAPNKDRARSAGMALLELKEPQPVPAEPLILDFELETKRPWLQLSNADDRPKSFAGDKAIGNPATDQNLGTLYFVGSTNGLKSRNEDRELTAIPVIRELVLQPGLCCGPISFRLSLEGQAFKFHKAELEQQHQHQEGAHSEAKPQKLFVTLHPLQQLKLLVEYIPPTTEVTEADEEKKCYGKISAFFHSARTPCINGEFGVQKLLEPPRHHQDQRIPAEGALVHTLLSGILNLLHPDSDPRPFLSLGLAALQEGNNLEQNQLAGKQQRQLHQEELLVKQIGDTFPVAAKAAAAALASASSGHDKMGFLNDPLDSAEANACSTYEEGFTQTVSLIGICRHAQLLLLAPTEETPSEQQQHQQQLQQDAFSGWASYTNIQSPLVIDFSTSHVNPRRRPSKILKLRAATAMPMEWQISHCNSSCTTMTTVDNNVQPSCDFDNQQERAKSEAASAFVLSCVRGTLASHRERGANKNEANICIRFMPRHAGRYSSLFSVSGEHARTQYFELRGTATTDEAFDVCASIGDLVKPPLYASPEAYLRRTFIQL
ncbi:hypothetical protein Esti_003183 [Eimeria stiedai]